ncbi:uncharacterized protein [Dysidea avara]|uniref:uncharacterized protein n=1 Tax=Dysidea avara TaxID=196820 RepID=UPI003319EA15
MGSDCYLMFSNETVLDMNDNQVIGEILHVANYIPDITPPEIIGLTVSMSLGNFTFTFSEAVNVSTFMPTSVILHNINILIFPSLVINYTLTGGTRVTEDNGLTVSFYLNPVDVEVLRVNDQFYTNLANSFFSAVNTTIADMSRNLLSPSSYQRASMVHSDSIGPIVVNASLNMTSGELLLLFSETVSVTSFNPYELTIQDMFNATVSYTLTTTRGFVITEDDSLEVAFTLNPVDLLELQAIHNLAASATTTYITYTEDLVQDLSDNNAQPRVNAINPLLVGDYFLDTINPELTQFNELNLNSRVMILTFDEPVDIRAINTSLITIQQYTNNIVRQGSNYTLTGGTVTYDGEMTNLRRRIQIELNRADYKNLILNELLGTQTGNTFLSLVTGAVFDFASNPQIQIEADMGVQALRVDLDRSSPNLESFDFDLDNGLLTLTFDNILDPSTLDPTAVTLQNNLTSTIFHTLTGGFSNSTPDYTIMIYVTTEDLNEIKNLTGLATTPNNTYLTFGAELINSYIDLNVFGRDVVAITDGAAAPVDMLTPDTTDPQLMSFDLDLDNGELLLTFDETVNASSFDILQATLLSNQSLANSSLQLTFRETNNLVTMSSTSDGTVITIALGFDDLNDLKRITELATNESNTFIALTNVTVVDMSGNLLTPVSSTNAEMVNRLIPDRTSPKLVEFVLDVNEGELFLTFDETVNISTLMTQHIRIQRTSNSSDFVELTQSSYSNSTNDYIMLVHISTPDLNEIKRHQLLAQNVNTTFMAIRSAAIEDMNDNSVVPITAVMALQASNYTRDITNPNLLNFTLNMDNGVLTLVFDETVDVSTFVYTSFTFFSTISDFATMFQNYTMTHGSSITNDSDVVDIQITLPDQYTLKLLTLLATDQSNSFLRLRNGTVHDMATIANPLNSIVIGAYEFIEDTTPPLLTTFITNLNIGILTLIFNEPVNASSLRFNYFTVQSSLGSPEEEYHFRGGSTNSPNGRFIDFHITDNDLNQIKKMERLLISNTTSFIRFLYDAVRDMNNNSIVAVSQANAVPNSMFVNDTNRPLLRSFDLDMDAPEKLTLYFNETIDIETFAVDQITLQLDFNVTDVNHSYQLMNGNVSMMDNTTVMILLDIDDVNELKTRRIAVNEYSTYLTVTDRLVQDHFDQYNLPLENNLSALEVSVNYTEDLTPPQLVNFTLNLNLGCMYLTFSETVNSATFNATALTLQNSEVRDSDPDSYFAFTGITDNWNMDIPIQKVTIGKDDLDEIKRLSAVATNENNTYLSIDRYGIRDIFGNEVIEITADDGLQVIEFDEDRTPPSLERFSLNLTSEILTLFFSETVNASTLDITGFTLHNEMLSTNFTLTEDSDILGGDPIGLDSTVIYVMLGRNDLNTIKRLTDLATTSENTFISVMMGSILDMNNNRLNAIPASMAINVTSYYNDFINPGLYQFNLDMNIGLLTLIFNETVNATSLRPDQITLLGVPSNTSVCQLTLSSAYNTSMEDSTIIDIYLLDSDLNEIKRQRGLAHNESNTYLSLTSETLTDMNGNPVVAILPTDAELVTEFVNDTTPPRLLMFDLNLTSEVLTLYFSETVRVEMLAVNKIILSNENATSMWMLRYGNAISNDSTVVTIQLDTRDLNKIKIMEDLATSQSNTYIAVMMRLIQDMNFNWNTFVSINDPIPVRNYTADNIDPALVYFNLDMDAPETLTLVFTESVDVRTLNVTEITLYSDPSDVNTTSYTLLPLSYSNSSNGPEVIIELHKNDSNALKGITSLAIGTFSTFINFTSDMIQDMNDNYVEPLTRSDGHRVNNYTEDETHPILEQYDLDLNTGELILAFSETMNGQTLNTTRFVLHNTSNSTGSSFQLTSRPTVEEIFDIVLIIRLTEYELNEIKRISDLATDNNTTYLQVMNNSVYDTSINSNQLVPINDELQQVRFFRPDITDPVLVNFVVNVDAGIITLEFNETVLASSLNLAQITLQSTMDNSNNSSYTLTNSSWTEEDSTVINITLSFFDLNEIKKIRNLASNESGSNTFMSITNLTITDMNLNSVVAIPSSSALPVRDIVPDTTPPQLVSFDLNLNSEQIILMFTETVDRTTLVFSEITLLDDNFTTSYSLNDSTSPSSDEYIIVIQLGVDDINNIKRDRMLAVSNTTTHINLTQYTITDMNNNELNFSYPLQVSLYQPDTISPVVVCFDLNMNDDLLILTFNETVRVPSLNITEVVIQDYNFTVYRRLETGIPQNSDDPIVSIELLPVDTNYIKTFVGLATDINNTYISLSNFTIADMAGNLVTAVDYVEPQQVKNYTEDTTSPTLVSFELDLTSEEIRFIFDETVNINSLDVSQIYLSNFTDNMALSYRLTGGISSPSMNSTHVNLTLTTTDLNEIKKYDDLATNESNTFLSFSSALLVDMNNNYVIPEIAEQVMQFYPDLVQPELDSFRLDMNTGLLHLMFSETVRVSTLNTTNFIFQNVSIFNESDSSYRLQFGYSNSSNGPEITVVLDTIDLNNIKRFADLATDENNTYLVVESLAIQDMNNNFLIEINSTDALGAAQVIGDKTEPELVSFDLDMNSTILWLTFDETILVESLNVRGITLISSDLLQASNYTLTNSTLLASSIDDTVVPVQLSIFDSNEIKKIIDLATNENNTYLLITNYTVTDMRSNPVIAVDTPLQVRNFTDDETPPILERFDINMDSRALILFFSETVNSSALQVEGITLQDNETAINETVLLAYPSQTLSENGPVVEVMISNNDFYYLTSLVNLYNSENDSYLSVSAGAVVDMRDNILVPIDDGEAIMVEIYTPDTTNPNLLNFTVDLDLWQVYLLFDETLALSTIDYTRFHVYSDMFGTINLTLTNGSVDSLYSHNVTLNLTKGDVDRIKLAEYLWVDVNNTWLYAELGAVYDWAMDNPLNETVLQSTESPIENAPPNLINYAVNLTAGIIILNFDEPVRPDTLIFQKFTLEETDGNSTMSYQLRERGSTSPNNGLQVILTLSFTDLNNIKAYINLFTMHNTTYLTLMEGAIADMVGNPSAPVIQMPAAMFYDDFERPSLVSYDLDMNTGQIFLTFSETVDVSSFIPEEFILQSQLNVTENDTMAYYSLSNESTAFSTVGMLDNRLVTINISLDDLNEIKKMRIADNEYTSWLVFSERALVDNNLQMVVPLINGLNTQMPQNYTPDTTSPVLLNFDIDLNEGTLVFSFSETVDATTLQVEEITLQNTNDSNFTESYNLTDSTLLENVTDINNLTMPISTFNAPILKLYFSPTDLNAIKKLSSLATELSDTYLSITNQVIKDMVGNNVTAIPQSEAQLAQSYVNDTTDPVLLGFELNMNVGNLTLTFSETINVASLNVTYLTIQSESDLAAVNYTLTAEPPYPNGSKSFSDDGLVIIIALGHVDLNAIKKIRTLATSSNDTYLSWSKELIQDMAGNFVVERNTTQAIDTLFYEPDETRPTLTSFDLDMDDGRLILTFSETVQVIDTIDVTQITLIADENITNDTLLTYTLTDATPYESSTMDEDSPIVTIMLGFTDLNALKYRSELAISRNDTYVIITNMTVYDMRNNSVVEVEQGLQCRIHTPDFTGPVLVNFTLSMDNDTLVLTFNETVNASSLDVGEVTIQSGSVSLPDYHSSSRTLTAETYTMSDNDFVIIINLGPSDRNEIKRRQNLAVSSDTTFIGFTNSSIRDMNDNNVVAIVDGNATQVNIYVPDETPPVVDSFTIDMDEGVMVLTFDETVNASSFDVTGFSLQDNETYIDYNFTFTNGRHTLSDSTILTLNITTDDLNEIKRRKICRQISDCYLLHMNESVYDMAMNSIEERADGFGLEVLQHYEDVTRPILLSFVTNLTAETITMTFTETVNSSSLNFSAITLQDFFEGSSSYTLTSGTRQERDSTVVTFNFSLVDLNEIKRITEIFTVRTDSWLVITQYAILDMALDPNYVVEIENTTDLREGLVTEMFYPDFVDPVLWWFDLNMTTHQLILYFSETVLSRTLMIGEITLQNHANISEDSEYVTLTMGELPLHSMSFTPDYHIIMIELGQEDTDAIKAFTDLATNENNTFISFSDLLIEDMNRNPVVPISAMNAKMVQNFYEDTIDPRLLGFDMDMDTGILTLTFTETINASSLNVNEITIQASQDGNGTSWRLNDGLLPFGSVTESRDSAIIEIKLGTTDLNAIKWYADLATDENNAFLSMTSLSFRDMNKNSVEDVLFDNATKVSMYVNDSTSPKLVSFDLDLNLGVLSMTFDETVNVSSFIVHEIVIQDANYSYIVSTILWHQLEGGAVSTNDSTIVDVMLDVNDLNEIKRLTDVATNDDNTYIRITSDLVRDMNTNPVEEIINGRAIQVTRFTPDMIGPEIVEYHLDMNTGVLHLTFSETVDASSLDITSLTIQSAESQVMDRFRQLTEESVDLNGQDSTVISVTLGFSDINRIKDIDMLALGRESTFIVAASYIPDDMFSGSGAFSGSGIVGGSGDGNNKTLIFDMNGNPLVPIRNGDALQADDYTPDMTSPFLISYHFDFIDEEATLHFNEPINVSTINFDQISLQDGLDANDSYTLIGGMAFSYNDSLTIVIQFNETDIDNLKLHPSLTTSTEDTHLTFTETAFFDKATIPNPIIPLIDGVNATQVTTFTYYPTPIFVSVRPTAGRASGGTVIIVEGGNFGPVPGEPGARQVDVLLNNVLSINTTVILSNYTLSAITPVADDTIIDQYIQLTVTIDSSALMVNISEAFRYLLPPIFTRIFPITGRMVGDTFVTIYGRNFGPSTESGEGPVVTVDIGNMTCTNVTVYNDTTLSCRTPELPVGTHDILITVDEVSVLQTNGFRSLLPPIVQAVSPSSTFKDDYTNITITGSQFGPTTASGNGKPLRVYLTTEFNRSECNNPIVTVNDTEIVCEAEPNLGPANITIIVDSVTSMESDVVFFYHDNAGVFSYENAVFFVSELAMYANVSLVRQDYPPFESPAIVNVTAYDGSARSGAHFEATNDSIEFPYDVNQTTFTIKITAASYLPNEIRKGETDDVVINLLITTVEPMHGNASIGLKEATLTIKAICETITHVCIADWDTGDNSVKYYRLDELP